MLAVSSTRPAETPEGPPLGPRPHDVSATAPSGVGAIHALIQLAILLLSVTSFWLLHTYLPEHTDPTVDILIDFCLVVVAVAASAILAYRAGMRESATRRSAAIVLDTLPVGVGIVDSGFHFTYANPALGRLLGVPASELLGRETLAFAHPEELGLVKAERALRKAGASSSYHRRLRRPDGATVPTLVVASPFWKEGAFDGELFVAGDLTDLQAAEGQARHFQKLSGFLFDAVTHDLSNSMQAVLGLVQVAGARTAQTDAAVPRVLDRAAAAALRGAKLVSDVKLIAQAERVSWPKATMTLRALVDQAGGLADVPASVRLGLSFGPASAERTTLANDLAPLALGKVIEEAAEGASKERPQIDVTVEVLSQKSRGERATFVVSGCGQLHRPEDLEMAMASPDQHRLGDTTWRSGVRLALASAIAQAHGWTLRAQQENGGTTFRLEGIELESSGGAPNGETPRAG